MSEILSQDEIDQLLTAITPGEGEAVRPQRKARFENIGAFESYLLETRSDLEPQYGLFDRNVTMLRFFDAPDGEQVLQDIKLKNESEGMGVFKIPNTKIELINYSICPKCKHIFSFKDLSAYYTHPRPDPQFKNEGRQFREDTRMFCGECETYFLPALVIADGTPKNEAQFLCRVQTMEAIERFYREKNMPVLSRLKKNRIQKQGVFGIKNDVLLKELEYRPALIINLLQYTPANLVINLIEGVNIQKGDMLFGEWTA